MYIIFILYHIIVVSCHIIFCFVMLYAYTAQRTVLTPKRDMFFLALEDVVVAQVAGTIEYCCHD